MMGNMAIFGTLSGELFAYQIENDFKLWSYKFDGPIHLPAIQVGDQSSLGALPCEACLPLVVQEVFERRGAILKAQVRCDVREHAQLDHARA